MTIQPRSRSNSGSSDDSNAAFPSFEALAPTREFTTTPLTAENRVVVKGIPDVRLKVDAGPGCGGIAWLSGEVSMVSRVPRRGDEGPVPYISSSALVVR